MCDLTTQIHIFQPTVHSSPPHSGKPLMHSGKPLHSQPTKTYQLGATDDTPMYICNSGSKVHNSNPGFPSPPKAFHCQNMSPRSTRSRYYGTVTFCTFESNPICKINIWKPFPFESAYLYSFYK